MIWIFVAGFILLGICVGYAMHSDDKFERKHNQWLDKISTEVNKKLTKLELVDTSFKDKLYGHFAFGMFLASGGGIGTLGQNTELFYSCKLPNGEVAILSTTLAQIRFKPLPNNETGFHVDIQTSNDSIDRIEWQDNPDYDKVDPYVDSICNNPTMIDKTTEKVIIYGTIISASQLSTVP
jgi:hypothetical protein